MEYFHQEDIKCIGHGVKRCVVAGFQCSICTVLWYMMARLEICIICGILRWHQTPE